MTPEFVAETPANPWDGALSALIALIEKPGCTCHYVDIGVGYQKVAESSDCPQCTPFGLADLLLGEIRKHGFVHESEFVQAVDSDGDLMWRDDADGAVVFIAPGEEGPAAEVFEKLYRRVTEPAGSVTP
jgi:hypothetical protein